MKTNQLIQRGGAVQQSSGGAIGRLRQTPQQAQETVSNRLTQTRAGYLPSSDQQANEGILVSTSNPECQQNVTLTINLEEKENQGAAARPAPGDADRCRVCVKAIKPDEYFKECAECGLRVCDDSASYSNSADGNEAKKFHIIYPEISTEG